MTSLLIFFFYFSLIFLTTNQSLLPLSHISLSLSICVCMYVCVCVCSCVNPYIFSESDCLLANGKFHYPSRTQEECHNISMCWTPDYIKTGLLIPPINGNHCPDGGHLQTLFQWEEAQWNGGSWVSSLWLDRMSVTPNSLSPMIDNSKYFESNGDIHCKLFKATSKVLHTQ